MEDRCIVESVKKTYMDAHKPKTLKHVEAVAGTAVWLAGIHYLDQAKTETAAMLHDISVIMTPPEMYELAKERSMTIDPAEEKYPFLLHQRPASTNNLKALANSGFHHFGANHVAGILSCTEEDIRRIFFVNVLHDSIPKPSERLNLF